MTASLSFKDLPRCRRSGVIEGKDFADALFSVWLGAHPVQEDKKALLSG